MSAIPLHPRLPCELIDRVIECSEAMVSCLRKNYTIPSWCLVSRRCRHHINTWRFSEIEIDLRDRSARKIERLASVLTSSVWPAHERVGQYVRSCTIVPAQEESVGETSEDLVKSLLLAFILQRIFRGDGPRPTGRIYSLSLIGSEEPFTSLGPYVAEELHKLCSETYLTNLSIECLRGVPARLIASSTVTHLQLQCVTFSSSAPVTRPLKNLQQLTLLNSPTFAEYIVRSDSTDPANLPSLVDLRYLLTAPHGIHREGYNCFASMGPHIEKLTVALGEDFNHIPLPTVTERMQFKTLRSMKVNVHERVPFPPHRAPRASDARRRTFSKIVDVLPAILPPILNIHAGAYVLVNPNSVPVRGAIDEVYLKFYDRSLEEYLRSQQVFPASQVIIKLSLFCSYYPPVDGTDGTDLKALNREYESHMRGLLASLGSVEGVHLEIEVRAGMRV